MAGLVVVVDVRRACEGTAAYRAAVALLQEERSVLLEGQAVPLVLELTRAAPEWVTGLALVALARLLAVALHVLGVLTSPRAVLAQSSASLLRPLGIGSQALLALSAESCLTSLEALTLLLSVALPTFWRIPAIQLAAIQPFSVLRVL
jgi:hypothetical protein